MYIGRVSYVGALSGMCVCTGQDIVRHAKEPNTRRSIAVDLSRRYRFGRAPVGKRGYWLAYRGMYCTLTLYVLCMYHTAYVYSSLSIYICM